MSPIRVLLAGQAPDVRDDLARQLRQSPALELVGVARDTDEAIVLTRARYPEVAVLTLLPSTRSSGVGADRVGCPGLPNGPTGHEDRITAVQTALGERVRACVVRAGSVEEILEGIWLESLRGTPLPGMGTGPLIDLRHQSGRDEATLSRKRTERLLSVLQGQGLFVVFQSICHLKSHRVVGYEALARFTVEPHRGPGYWFAEAAALGLGVSLELAAARAALAEIHRLPPDTYVAVNLSPEAASSNEFRLLLAGVPRDRVVVELTEHVPDRHDPGLDSAFRGLRHQGVRVAIDHVGAGYSNLGHIMEVAPEFLKLDLSPTGQIDAQRTGRSLASALAKFAKDIGAEIIADGVETESDVQALLTLDVAFGQGTHLGTPGPLPDRIKNVSAIELGPQVSAAQNTRVSLLR